jgi:hypothetical protein
MRVAAFIGFLIGIGLIVLTHSFSFPNGTPEAGLVAVFFMTPGVLLIFVCPIIWVRLTVLGWVIRFAAFNWQTGKDQYLRRGDRPQRKQRCSMREEVPYL